MPSSDPTALLEVEDAATPNVEPSPYLHLGEDRIYNPLAHQTLAAGEVEYDLLRGLLAGTLAADALPAPARARLEREHWIAPRGTDLSTRYYLRYVTLEAHTVCNQACYFCPVSIAPREDYFMSMEQYESIVRQLVPYRATIEGVSMINYNEPTADRRFLDQLRCLREHGLPPAVLTNGSGLTPDRADAIVAMGGLYYLSINLSTLDRDRYKSERGADHLKTVLRNLDHLRDLPLAPTMEIVVLGTGNEVHQRDFAEIEERFAGSRFVVKSYEVMDRAGYLEIGLRPTRPHQKLRGCENVGSRPLQHLHITPRGKCVLCCEDYDEYYVVGDLNETPLAEILAGPQVALMRRWVYGVEDAPAGFMCRKCVFARTE